MELFIDTETSDMVKWKLPFDDPSQPWIVQLGMILSDENRIYHEVGMIIYNQERTIQPGAQKIHGISEKVSHKYGTDEQLIADIIAEFCVLSDILICHNTSFDLILTDGLMKWRGFEQYREKLKIFCTMINSTNLCKLPGRYGNYKWPKLQELHKFLFGHEFEDAHDALSDVRATRRCYYEMKRREKDDKDQKN